MRNCGPVDRAVRILIGLALLAIAVWPDSLGPAIAPAATRLAIELGAIGIVLLGTGIVGISPLYLAFRHSTAARP